MKEVTLYEVTARVVEIGDAYTLSRNNITGPRCHLGDGLVLLGVDQRPLGDVWPDGSGGYFTLAGPLREVLEAPLLAAAEQDAALLLAAMAQDLATSRREVAALRDELAGRAWRERARRALAGIWARWMARLA